jgi:hypothetical protein
MINFKNIVADTIYFGLISRPNFQNASGFAPEDVTPETRLNQENRPSLLEGVDLEQFRNLSAEERRAMMQEIQGGSATFFNRQSGSGSVMIRGEIIDKNEMVITIKLIDGGSILVFYSDQTKIIKIINDQNIE